MSITKRKSVVWVVYCRPETSQSMESIMEHPQTWAPCLMRFFILVLGLLMSSSFSLQPSVFPPGIDPSRPWLGSAIGPSPACPPGIARSLRLKLQPGAGIHRDTPVHQQTKSGMAHVKTSTTFEHLIYIFSKSSSFWNMSIKSWCMSVWWCMDVYGVWCWAHCPVCPAPVWQF